MSSIQGSRSTGGQPPTVFESLAPEILISIIKQLPDLVSLDSLLRASPLSFRLFNNYGTEITDAILSSGYTHMHICEMIRVTALIRTSKLPMNNLSDFLDKTTYAAMRERIHHLREQLEANTPPAVLRGILASNRHITNLSLEFIKIHLERFRALKPRRLIDATKYRTLLPVICRLPKDRPMEEYPVRDVGLHSWNEEQRVVRIFWRIQIVYDMKKAGANRMLDWSEEEITYLDKMTLVSFYNVAPVTRVREPHPEYYTMASVQRYLCESYNIANLSDISSLLWIVPPHPPIEVKRVGPPPIPDALLPNSKSRGYISLINASTGTCFYFHQTPLRRGVSFLMFEKWGFAFWGKSRLKGYGFLPEVLQERRVEPAYICRWLSVLDDEVSPATT